MRQKSCLGNITIKVFFIGIAVFAELAFAFNGASANFVYDYGRMFEAQLQSDRINFNAKILQQNPLSVNWNSTNVKSEGGEVVFLTAGFPFNINSFILEPSFLFVNGSWQKGDFDYFYGKPDIPKILGFSISFCRGSGFFMANYVLGNLKLLNNAEDAELFNSDFYVYNAFYGFNASEKLNLSVGFAGLNVEATGTLTAENQQYFLFPYLFYIANGYMNAKVAYGSAYLGLKSKVAEYGIDFGTFYMLDGELKGDMHYKHRKFYGTEEFFETLNPVQFSGNGFVFLILGIKTKKINIGENYIQYGVKKPLVVPFGKNFPSGSGDIKSREFLKDVFLWGLTASASIYF